jgi:hypothetical protein
MGLFWGLDGPLLGRPNRPSLGHFLVGRWGVENRRNAANPSIKNWMKQADREMGRKILSGCKPLLVLVLMLQNK